METITQEMVGIAREERDAKVSLVCSLNERGLWYAYIEVVVPYQYTNRLFENTGETMAIVLNKVEVDIKVRNSWGELEL